MALLALGGVCTRMLLYPIMYKSAMLCNKSSRCGVDGEDKGPCDADLGRVECVARSTMASDVKRRGRCSEQQKLSINYLS